MKPNFALISILLISKAIASSEAFVVNNLAETLSRIDLETGLVQNHITVLGDTPNQVDYHDGFIYALNSISANLQKIDPQSHQVIADILLPVGSNPYSMEFDATYAYVSGWVSGRIYRVNLNTNQVDDYVEIGGFPEGVLFHDGYLYVAQTGFNPNDFSYGQGRMAIIDATDLTLIDEINVGKNPQSVILGPDSTLHVVCTGNYFDISGSIYIFDLNSQSVFDSILIGGQPVSGAIWRDTVFLAAGGWDDMGHVYSYESRSRMIIRGPSNPIEVGMGAMALAVDSLGIIYSCAFGIDMVSRFNVSGEILGSYALGDGPQSIVIVDDRSTDIVEPEPLPEQPRLAGSYPNPFNDRTMITFTSAPGSSVRVSIFDLQGRLVTRIPAETKGGGGKVIWDGRDSGGRNCSSGPYFALISSANRVNDRELTGNVIKLTYVR